MEFVSAEILKTCFICFNFKVKSIFHNISVPCHLLLVCKALQVTCFNVNLALN
jgi:hypothetical protein